MLAAAVFFLILKAVKAAAGLQAFTNGAAEIQLAAVAATAALGRQFAVDLAGDGLDDSDSLGDLRILELADIPQQKANFRI